jgi:DNA-directed RNA polymerase specialized sigma24 family protein
MESAERIERLLALILIHDMQDAQPTDKAIALSRAGFTPAEIGSLLGVRPNTIAVQLSRAKPRPKRKVGGKKAPRRRTAK